MITLYTEPPNDAKRALILIALFILLTIALCLTGCSPEKRLSRLLKEHPELATAKTITTVHHDTLMTKEIHKDSVINNIYSRDTVYIKEGRETVKYVYENGSKAYISADVKADTIIKIDSVKSKQTTVIQQVKAPLSGFDNFSRWLVIIALCATCLYFGGKMFMPLIKTWLKF